MKESNGVFEVFYSYQYEDDDEAPSLRGIPGTSCTVAAADALDAINNVIEYEMARTVKECDSEGTEIPNGKDIKCKAVLIHEVKKISVIDMIAN